jgi:hypothetical protein
MLTFCLILASADGFAADAAPDTINVIHAWVPAPAAAGSDTPLYMTIANNGPDADSLIRSRCAFSDFTEKVTVDQGEGSPSTREVKSIPIPPGQTVTLGPDGYHIVLLHTTEPLRPGQTVGCTITFQKAGTRQIEVTVAQGQG